MKWVHLFNRIGRQALSVANHEDIYALLDMKDGLGSRKVYLKLKFDEAGKPYLIEDNSVKEKSESVDTNISTLEELKENIGKKIMSRGKRMEGIIKDVVLDMHCYDRGYMYSYIVEWPGGKITRNRCSKVKRMDDDTLQVF